ncbi:MAG: RagB/SusD family nutrient uptake outer membrane protein [Chitinophagaceae bacterium]|nr:MAG: RagB/SusD family nutrient uptake outer membrane protein [Chitinophagaceae bacterium]
MKNKIFIKNNIENAAASWMKPSVVVALIAILFFGASCNKFLDVRPEGELIEKDLLVDANGFESALYGVYGTLNNKALYGEQLSHNMVDVLAQYFTCAGNNNVDNLLKYNYAFTSVETILNDAWAKQYSNITYANNVLKNLERFSPSTLQYYNVYKGEALGLRAFMHFDLVRLFTENIKLNPTASGIPYSTDFSINAPKFVRLDSVYNYIIADLTQAENLLSEDANVMSFPKVNGSYPFLKDRETHFNLYAVQATLARVYLTKGDHANAALYAEKVINSGKFQLLTKTELGNGVGKGMVAPKEAIFGLFNQALFTTVRDRFLLQTTFYSYDNRSNINQIYNGITEGHDYRWDAYFKLPSNQVEKLRFSKLVDNFQLNDQEYLRPADYIKGTNMIRLPEMYYIAAEALLSTNPDKARDYFDIVLKSRGITALKDRVPAVDLTVDLISEDRYKEFIGEGQSFFNMKRLNSNIINTALQTVPASKAIYVLPIPKNEFDYRN